MRALLTSALLAATLGACASRTPAVSAPQPQIDAPLSARLFPPQYGQIAVALSKPAFVALFEVVPGRGASLVYPTAGTGFTPVRETWVPLRYNPQRWLYARNHYDASWRSGARYAGYGGYGYGYAASAYGGHSSGPRYFFLVASEDPIAVEQFQSEASSVRRFLGVSFDSYRPYDVMEELAYALLPYSADERWVTDVIVDWGYDWGNGYGPMAAYSYARWEPVVCADGSVRMARYISGWGYDNLPCRLRGSTRPPVLPVDPTDPGTPPDSVGDGRERLSKPSGTGRTRQGAAGAGEATMPPEEVRRRITELREDAARQRFGEELNQTVRRSVQLRQRADALTGGSSRAAAAGSSRTVRTSPSRQADEAYRRADQNRERERRQAAGTSTTRRSTAGTRSRSGEGSSARPSSSSGETRSRGSASSEPKAGGSSSSGSGSSTSSGSSSSGSSTGSGTPSSGRSRIPPAN